jgi:hypothetical protein
MAMNGAKGKRIATDCIISFNPSFRPNKQRPDREKADGIQMAGRAHLASDYQGFSETVLWPPTVR